MPTNKTPHYSLSQWERDDRILMEDFNADNVKIDAAIKANTDALASQGEALAGLSNGRVHIGSYVGTGQSGKEHPNSYTFPVMPACFFVLRGGGTYTLVGRGGAPMAAIINSGNMSLTWNGNTMSWYDVSANGQFNVGGAVYLVIAFYAV